MTLRNRRGNGYASCRGHPNGKHGHYQLYSGQLSTSVNERYHILRCISQSISLRQSGKCPFILLPYGVATKRSSLTFSLVLHSVLGGSFWLHLDLCGPRYHHLFCINSRLCSIASLGRFFESFWRAAELDKSRVRHHVDRSKSMFLSRTKPVLIGCSFH